jgi:hypothetical protein
MSTGEFAVETTAADHDKCYTQPAPSELNQFDMQQVFLFAVH